MDPCGSRRQRRAPFALRRSQGISRRVRSSSARRTPGTSSASRLNPGRGAATGCRTCSTSISGWRRRSSCTCGHRSWSRWRSSSAAVSPAGSRSSAAGWRSPSRFPDFDLRRGDVAARLASLAAKPLNFDPASLDGPGWERDDYRQPLPAEPPGLPVSGGSWELAAQLSRAYAFADPALVEARFDATVPLDERELLLVLHVLGARVYAGVRVGGAGEELREGDGREARVAFWNYRTLEG